MEQPRVSDRTRALILAIDRFAFGVARHWLALFILVYGAWVLAPFLAPIFRQTGNTQLADATYGVYSLFCHQLPQRSLFLFGEKPMYSLAEIKSVWELDGFDGLRQFNGNAQFGWKVAWSDRMISFYGSVWLGGLLFALWRKRLKPLSLRGWFSIGILPVALDGATHFVNDIVAGTSGAGFRDTNAWLAFLTGNILPPWFYAGDALGSFNSDLRWVTGILFGLATAWFIFPMVDDAMRDVQTQAARQLERKVHSP